MQAHVARFGQATSATVAFDAHMAATTSCTEGRAPRVLAAGGREEAK